MLSCLYIKTTYFRFFGVLFMNWYLHWKSLFINCVFYNRLEYRIQIPNTIYSRIILVFVGWLFNTRIHCENFIFFYFANSLYIKKFFAKTAWINYLYREFTLNPLFYSQISDKRTICFANSLCIRYFFAIVLKFAFILANSLFISRIQFKFAYFLAGKL